MSPLTETPSTPQVPSRTGESHPDGPINVPDDGFVLPPILMTSSIITSQPSSQDEHRSSRRPEPADWLSASRGQLSAFSGTYFLSSVEQLELLQVVDLNTLLGKAKNGAQYRVRVPRSETIFLAVEESAERHRRLLRSSRPLVLNVMDPSGETAFVMRKSVGWGCLPGFLHQVTVESSQPIGSVEQNFTLLGISFTVYDDSRQPLCYIDGPNLYSCCMSSNAQFQIVSLDKSRQIASLMRQWDHLLVDYSFLLTFTPGTDVKLKGLLLGAAFLLEFLFFEHQSR